MDAIGNAIGEALAGVLADPITGVILRLAAAYVVLVWLAVALWAFVDMRRRTHSPAAAYAAAAIIIVASPLLFLPALIVHRILRPADFTSERRFHQHREAALEAETIAARCPECQRTVDEEWLICPTCRLPLRHRCLACGSTVGLDWLACASCGEELEGKRPISVAAQA